MRASRRLLSRSCHRPAQWAVAALGAVAIVAAPAAGQTAGPQEQPLLGSVWTLDQLRDFPTSNNPLALLEAAQPEAIADRFTAGGLNAASPPRFGGFLNSWTQTQFRIGDVNVTDPRTGGTPLLLPILPFWDRVVFATGAMGPEDSAPGLSVALDARRPASAWSSEVEGWGSGSSLVAGGNTLVPAVDRVHQWVDGSALVSGPATPQLGVSLGAAWRRIAHVGAPDTSPDTDSVASGFGHFVYSVTPRDEARLLGWAQRVSTASQTDMGVHVQSAWEHRDPDRSAWRLFGGYTDSRRTTTFASTVVLDSLTSDPVSSLFDSSSGSGRRWVIGARVAPQASQPLSFVGLDVEGVRMRQLPTGISQVRELVDGLPARIWALHEGSTTAARHLTTLSAFGNEHLALGGLAVDVGLRMERVSGAADAAATNAVDWTTWLPSAGLRWQLPRARGVTLSASYRRAAYQLPLNVLAIGDPAAAVADVSLWNGAVVGPAIARVGPGTAGDTAVTRIDPQLQRPVTSELVLAVGWRPTRSLQFELARITKREESLIAYVDTGVLASSYGTLQVPDPSFQSFNQLGAPQVTVYDRPPGAYGRDRYLLTNRGDDFARFWALQLLIRVTTDRLAVMAGAGLTEVEGPAAAIGFLPTENDQDVLGNLFVDPNAATASRGQLFQDRSHVVKLAGTYRFGGGVRLGVLARYQDGQPFARLVVAPNLTQGPTLARAYHNGGSAFTYIGTLDVRLQKTFAVGRSQVDAGVDVYNLPNLGNEVSEYVVSGPRFRVPTALQPPFTVLAGVRLKF
jgi:hypothetical protein